MGSMTGARRGLAWPSIQPMDPGGDDMIGLKQLAALIASLAMVASGVFVTDGGDGTVALSSTPGGGTEAVADGAAPIRLENLRVFDLTATQARLSAPATIEGTLGDVTATTATTHGPGAIHFGGQRLTVPPGARLHIDALTGSASLGDADLSTLVTAVGTAQAVTILPPQAPPVSTQASSSQGLTATSLEIDGAGITGNLRDAGQFDQISFQAPPAPAASPAQQLALGNELFDIHHEKRVTVEDFVGVVVALWIDDEEIRVRLDGYGNVTIGDERKNVSYSDEVSVPNPAGGDVSFENQPPEANFTYRPTLPTTGETVHFVDRSSDDIAVKSWKWDFGDGFTSTEQHPEHAYGTDGTYQVTLTVTDVFGEASAVTHPVPVANSRPKVTFSWDPVNPLETETVVFQARVEDKDHDVERVEWRFEDGVTMEGETVNRSFEVKGLYNVTVVAIDADDARGWANDTVLIRNAPPVAGFELEPTNPVAGTLATLRSTSHDPGAGHITNTTWHIPGVDTLYGSEVDLTFPRDGSVPVRIVVTDDDGERTQHERAVEIRNPPPEVSIRMVPTYPNPGESVDFYASVVDDDQPVDSRWSFTDGVDRTGLSVSRVFPSGGAYGVDLWVQDEDGANGTAERTFDVNHPPRVRLGVDGEGTDLEQTAALTGEEILIEARTSDADGNETTTRWLVDGRSPGALGLQACQTAQGDPETLVCAWPDDGNHTVRATTTDDNGASSRDSIEVLVINRVPTLDPEVLSPIANLGSPVLLQANAEDADGTIALVQWFMDDELAAEGQTAELTFEDAGLQPVTVSAVDDDGARENVTFRVDVNAAPTIEASATPRSVEAGDPVRFQADAFDPDGPDSAITLGWDFGDGTGSNDTTVEHAYTKAGEYNAKVTATDEHGATAQQTFTITVTTPPLQTQLSTSPSTPRANDPVRFEVSIADGRTIERIEWDLGDQTERQTGPGVDNITHIYAEPRIYTVTVTVHADRGDQETHVAEVRVTSDVAHLVKFAPRLPDGQCVNLDAPSVSFKVENTNTGESVALEAPNGTYVWQRSGACTLSQVYPPGKWALGDQLSIQGMVGGASTTDQRPFNTNEEIVDLDFVLRGVPLAFDTFQAVNRTQATTPLNPSEDKTTYHDPYEPVYIQGVMIWAEGTPVRRMDVNMSVSYRGPMDLLGGSSLEYRTWTATTDEDGSFTTLVPAPIIATRAEHEQDPEGDSLIYAPGSYRVRGSAGSSGLYSASAEFIEDPAAIMNELRENGIFV